jgi:hypothetical protein
MMPGASVRSFLSAVAAALGISALPAKAAPPPEQVLVVHFDYGLPDWGPYFECEKRVEAAVDSSGFGDYDGNELAVSGKDGSMYIYGPSADRLLPLVQPLLESCSLLKNVTVTLVYGPLGDKTVLRKVVRVGS